jgi:PAS domain S-box-containing protein
MNDRVNILLVDDQPAKLLSYEVILRDLGENLVTAASAREALQHLLKIDIAVILIDVCMPELDGFQLASMIRGHPRFERTAIIFISAIQITDVDRLRGYEMGAVDYVPVPVVPEVLRAKVRIFSELYRKTRQLEQLNRVLEQRVAERTAELEASTARLIQSERLRSLALAAGQMGSWDWEIGGDCLWDEGQRRIFGVDQSYAVTADNVRALIDPDDVERLQQALLGVARTGEPLQTEFNVRRPNGELRRCMGTVAASIDASGRVARMSGVTVDITERREAEERQALLAREVDHRARNALAVVQSIVRLSRAQNIDSYVSIVEGRIRALALAHILLSQSRWQGADLRRLVDEELAPFRTGESDRVSTAGPEVLLHPASAQALAVALHELSTNAAKYGALSSAAGRLALSWELLQGVLVIRWIESGGPPITTPSALGYGSKVITAAIERQLGGRVQFDWREGGLRCTFYIPRSDAPQPQAADGIGTAARGPAAEGHDDGRARILLVEDEALVAMMMREMLTELGFSVLGPYAKLAEAETAASEYDFDGAVLDVNLGGQMVYPVAQILSRRDLPFVFVTGYGQESIDPHFSQAPVLQKPVDLEALRCALTARSGRAPRQNGAGVVSRDPSAARTPTEAEAARSAGGVGPPRIRRAPTV